ncbi:MAG: proline dehydrogenase family protein [Phycisphaerae bacterium]
MAVAESLDLSPQDYELQMLAGMGEPLKAAIAEMGRCLRVYCPYGELIKGMAYLIRRLLENTSNDSFLKNRFGDRSAYDNLLRVPESAGLDSGEPVSATLPKRDYEDPFEDCSMIASSVGLDFTNATAMGFSNSEQREKVAAAIASLRSKSGKDRLLRIGDKDVGSEDWLISHDPAYPDQIVARVASADLAGKLTRRLRPRLRRCRTGAASRTTFALMCCVAWRRHWKSALNSCAAGSRNRKEPHPSRRRVVEAIDYFNYHAATVGAIGRASAAARCTR